MADCPQCGKKVPDNMKFCGFCGVELATGRVATTERWLAYMRTVVSACDTTRVITSEMLIASGALISGSIVTFISKLTAQTPTDTIIMNIGLFGLVLGVFLFALCYFSNQRNYRTFQLLDRAYVRALKGELSLSIEFEHALGSKKGEES